MGRKFFPVIWLSVFLLIFSACGKKNKISDEFNWLLGTWQFEDNSPVVYEHWWLANDSLMLGENYLVKEHEKIIQEEIKLYIEDVYFVYEPLIVGQNHDEPVKFKMKSRQNNAYLFENKNHDFPHYILYKKMKANHMIVVVGGKIKGKRITKTYKATRLHS